MTKRIRIYRTFDGRAPFVEWFKLLRDRRGAAKIRVRLRRVKLGNLGDHKSVGHGVIELRISFGPGYRLYTGLQGDEMIVLLCGGDKSTQSQDIAQAHIYWADYKRYL